MAARNFTSPRALVRELVIIAGSFAPNGSSAVSASSNKGLGWSVARTSAGLFTITFANKYADLVSVQAVLQLATGADQYVQVGTYTAASKTLEIRVWDASDAAVADVAANANNRINFVCFFRNSATGPTRGS
jgi:hypothetical protein